MEVYNVYEWSIENFSTWNGFLHGPMIPGPDVYVYSDYKQRSHSPFVIGLFPRGPTGRGEHLVVRIAGISRYFSGDISFLGSDKTLIGTQASVNATAYNQVFVSTDGPKFEEVCTLLETNETLRKDQLTLRLRVKGDEGHEVYMHTVLDSFDSTLKIIPESFVDTLSDTPEDVSVISLQVRCVAQELRLQLSKSNKGDLDEVMKFQLTPQVAQYAFSVSSCLSFLKNDDTLVYREQNEHVFQDTAPWTVSDSLTIKELKQRGYGYITLRLKFGMRHDLIHTSSRFSHSSLYPRSACLLLNKEDSFPKEKSFNNPTPAPINQPESTDNMQSQDLMGLYKE